MRASTLSGSFRVTTTSGFLPGAIAPSRANQTLTWSMIFSENRFPPRIKSGAGFFRIMP
jgi:hypothetical protein